MTKRYAERAPDLVGEDIQLVAMHSLWQQSVGQSPNTINHRQKVMRRFRYAVGVPLLEVTGQQCAQWQMSLAGMSAWSINTYVSHVKAFYDWARRYKHRTEDPTVDWLKNPRTPRSVPKPIPDDQLKVALACGTPMMRAMLALMAFAGLRCMEVASLRREDIRDTDEVPVITVTGKGGHTRIVPAMPVVLHTLQVYGMPRSGIVFMSPAGKPYTANRLSQVVNEFLHGIGIVYSAHKLRHAFGTSTYRLSGDLLLTQQLMGHSSPNTTQGYAKYSDDAADKLAALMDTRGRNLLGIRRPDTDPPAAAPAVRDPAPDPVPLGGTTGPAHEQPAGYGYGYGYGYGLRLIRGGAA